MKMLAYEPRSRLFERLRLSCLTATAVWWSVCAACHLLVDGGGRDEQKGSQVGENAHSQVLALPSYTALFLSRKVAMKSQFEEDCLWRVNFAAFRRFLKFVIYY